MKEPKIKVYDLHDKAGIVYAFEVGNIFLGRSGAIRIVCSIPNVTILRKPKFFSWFGEEVFCQFELDGHKFEIWEPFNDNSRYWIGPSSLEKTKQTEQIMNIRACFKRANAFGFLSGSG